MDKKEMFNFIALSWPTRKTCISKKTTCLIEEPATNATVMVLYIMQAQHHEHAMMVADDRRARSSGPQNARARRLSL
jgi:hypothetical protein